ncbi:unnamed protein product [Brachionus calyciflorus]|uniref:Uncharacterized protein n=1 Tax=Brachionus calyciflorus TaxID=104777 RepID=A0A813RB70_9BILA|nr:unnamed protein product [Brachionus calyciflorus]
MNDLNRCHIDYIKNKEILPTLEGSSKRNKDSIFNIKENMVLSNGSSYSSIELRLMRQVKEILESKNTYEIIKKKYLNTNKIEKTNDNLKFNVLSLDKLDKEYEIALPSLKLKRNKNNEFEQESNEIYNVPLVVNLNEALISSLL